MTVHRPGPVPRTGRSRRPRPGVVPRVPRRTADGRVRRPGPPPLRTQDQGSAVPAGGVATGLRLRRVVQGVDQGVHGTDPRLCAAIGDRLAFGGNIIETGTESYRLAGTRAAQAQDTYTN
ncbi:hypothetical protein STRIP9103_09330 [Streptomyces ipomoeae 91-03]|uniref:Uncharacterized protein n=1 Tax=Streptomyces ipomoeae 91-03 TaxID=698759 RepID=L1L725_9ACTN|nr:hypothetical protein STRIP9103_09330 [Streptomyces ipomoeae 91-03]